MKWRLFVAAAVVTVAAMWSPDAMAQNQPWLRDRRYGSGIGIRAGNLELHPSLAGELGYDSNYFQRCGAPAEPVIRAWRLRITPSLILSTLGGQRRAGDLPGAAAPKLNFTGQAAISYNELFATDRAYSGAASGQRNLSANAGAHLEILPSQPWGGQLSADFQRMAEPSNDPDARLAWDRDTVRFGAMVAWRPGGGMLDFRIGYGLQYNYFEKAAYAELNNLQHSLLVKGSWRFLPRTAVVYDGSSTWVRYPNHPGTLNQSSPIRSRIGLSGLVTSHLGMLAMLGWGASFYDGRATVVQDFDGVIAQAELKWYLAPQQSLPADAASVGLSAIAAGYTRDFQNSYLSDYTVRDRGYAKLEAFFAGMAVVSAEAGLANYGYPASFFAPGAVRHVGFDERRVDVGVFGEYRLTSQFGLNLTARYDSNAPRIRLPLLAQPTAQSPQRYDDLSFHRAQIFLGVRWFM